MVIQTLLLNLNKILAVENFGVLYTAQKYVGRKNVILATLHSKSARITIVEG